jgi:hypothetical protein
VGFSFLYLALPRFGLTGVGKHGTHIFGDSSKKSAMVQFAGGITWQRAPTVQQHSAKTGDNWYVLGIQRLETPQTNGWRHVEKPVYLQEEGSWGEKVFYFASRDTAETKLKAVLGETSEATPISAMAAALLRSRGQK